MKSIHRVQCLKSAVQIFISSRQVVGQLLPQDKHLGFPCSVVRFRSQDFPPLRLPTPPCFGWPRGARRRWSNSDRLIIYVAKYSPSSHFSSLTWVIYRAKHFQYCISDYSSLRAVITGNILTKLEVYWGAWPCKVTGKTGHSVRLGWLWSLCYIHCKTVDGEDVVAFLGAKQWPHLMTISLQWSQLIAQLDGFARKPSVKVLITQGFFYIWQNRLELHGGKKKGTVICTHLLYGKKTFKHTNKMQSHIWQRTFAQTFLLHFFFFNNTHFVFITSSAHAQQLLHVEIWTPHGDNCLQHCHTYMTFLLQIWNVLHNCRKCNSL